MKKFSELLQVFRFSEKADSNAANRFSSAETPSTICVPLRNYLPLLPASSFRIDAKKISIIVEDSNIGNAMFDQDDNTHTFDRNLLHLDDFIALRCGS